MNFVKKYIFNREILKYLITLVLIYIISFLYYINLETTSYRVFVIFFIIETFAVVFVYIGKIRNIKIEKIFIILACILGPLYMVMIPLGSVPDEHDHLARAYEICEGHFISQIDENGEGYASMPKEMYENSNIIYKDNNIGNLIKSESGEYIKENHTNTSLYSFICYIPQTIGIGLGKILHLNILLIAYLGRITNYIVWTVLIFFAIKNIPFYKRTLIFIALLPITMQEAVSLSADSLTIAVCIFFISYIMRLIFNKEGLLSKKDNLIIVLSLIFISQCKIVYLPLVLMLLLLPENRFKSKKEKYIKIGILVFIIVLINLIWLSISSRYLVEFNEGVNEKGQIIYILKNPIEYIKIIYLTLCKNGVFYLNTFFGQSLEVFNINLSKIYTFVILGVFIYILLKENIEKQLNKRQKLITIITLIGTVLLIFTALYIQWTPYKLNYIEGIQGRYFIPIIMLLPFILGNKNNKNIQKFDYIYIFLIVINLYALSNIYMYHIK